MTPDQFTAQLGMLLRDQPRGTAADLTDFAVAWWDGHSVVYAFLREDDSGLLDEEFELDDYELSDWSVPFCAWFNAPQVQRETGFAGMAEGVSPARGGVINRCAQRNVCLFFRHGARRH